jgi:hypothetical protein
MRNEQDDDDQYDPYTEEMAERDYPADFGEAFELDTDFIMPRTVDTVENEIAAMLLFGRERVGPVEDERILTGLKRAGTVLGYELVGDDNEGWWYQPVGLTEKLARLRKEREEMAREEQAAEMRVIGRAIEETTRDDMRRAS